MTASSEKRLNKFISESGFCSRREADRFIEQNRVTINGKKPELGTKVQPGDVVKVDGKLIKASAENKSDRIYIAYNKPVGIICITDSNIEDNIIDAIGYPQRIFPIGRLDKPSEGLIFLTNDGDIVNKILRAENAHDKEYIVTVDKPITEQFVDHMSRGVPILGTVTKPCKVTMQSRYVFKMILTQGLNRQIRRMCEHLGYNVTQLKRSRIMNVELGDLKPGHWRYLTEQEMSQINAAVKDSKKTASGVRSGPKAQNFTRQEYREILREREEGKKLADIANNSKKPVRSPVRSNKQNENKDNKASKNSRTSERKSAKVQKVPRSKTLRLKPKK
ncbi:23S rRNA pseudouridine(2604) synthase RluF [Thiomicrorhabdus sp.]|uniref:23S rRNA pseudouridine(2604) synthase RluF n=1 Tax=Thiomicrorhabdus sp. TaxID=2039724 RepID=UPI002AA69F04|nr:23S rRNA pseudouridine(2604) synthase RluF [Thiomicrorhabdus sp.]